MDTNESSVWRFDVPRYNTSADLARSLDLTISELEWFSDRGEWLRTKPLQLRHYRPMQISKKAGARLLEIPKPRLREIQRKILRRILDRREGLVEDRDLDTAFLQAIPIGHAQGDLLVIVEQSELHRLRHGVSWGTMIGNAL
jgi:hypothetical protein